VAGREAAIPKGLSDFARELRLYRRLAAFVGGVYLLWWVAVEALLPQAFNPLLGRLIVVVAIWGIVAASYASEWVRRHIRLLWTVGLWLLTAHYFYLFYENAGDINWVVGSFITVTGVSLAMMSRTSMSLYSVFAGALSLGLVILLPPLRPSVFLPGLLTVLLQANIGLSSRLAVIRDLAASNAHFQLLFNSTFEGVLIHEDGRIVQVNDALVRILGLSSEKLIGRRVLDLVHPDDRASAMQSFSSETVAPHQMRAVRSDGSAVDVETRSKPFPQGTRPSQLVTVEDISERKRQAAALRQANDALERSNRDLKQFAFIASHDLQTPLRSIASFVELLQSTYNAKLDAQGKDWLGRTSQSVKHLQMLIQDLLEYARVDAQPRVFERVAFREVLERTTMLLDAAILESKATITFGELPEVTGDRSQLVQLLLNLVDNAIKYRGSAAPQIHIAAQDKADEWLFEVRDNGIGIAPKHQQQVFEIFKRLHDQKEYPGTGIGLAMCRRVVGRHGGKIWVESQAGEGSVFYFTIAKEMVSRP
jgi:PAS domain S-box-containing protein